MITLKARERLSKAWIWARRSGIGLMLVLTFALPFLIYTIAKPSVGNVHALVIASLPTIALIIIGFAGILIGFARTRRIDALSIIALVDLVLSLLAFALGVAGGGVRFLQLRGQLAKVVIGLVFLASAAIGKPLIYQLARARIKRRSSAEVASFEAMRDRPAFRRAMMIMTLAWGTGLIAESAISYVLTFVLTVGQYLLVRPILDFSSIGALTAWTYWYARRAIGAARQGR
jgi:intracellular septation protein A